MCGYQERKCCQCNCLNNADNDTLWDKEVYTKDAINYKLSTMILQISLIHSFLDFMVLLKWATNQMCSIYNVNIGQRFIGELAYF